MLWLLGLLVAGLSIGYWQRAYKQSLTNLCADHYRMMNLVNQVRNAIPDAETRFQVALRTYVDLWSAQGETVPLPAGGLSGDGALELIEVACELILEQASSVDLPLEKVDMALADFARARSKAPRFFFQRDASRQLDELEKKADIPRQDVTFMINMRGDITSKISANCEGKTLVSHHHRHFAKYCALIERALDKLEDPLDKPVGPLSKVNDSFDKGHRQPGQRGKITIGLRPPNPADHWLALPKEIGDRVVATELDETCYDVCLRRYQTFGARFLLAQERVLMGDEMGLGKTIQALSAACHLHRHTKARLTLVICPAGLMTNWLLELAKTNLPVFLLHGGKQYPNLKEWITKGGIAVTSYGVNSKGKIKGILKGRRKFVDFLIVDEAHYIKNPASLRSEAIVSLIPICRRIAFLSGTPLENRWEEMFNLLMMLQPDVAKGIGSKGYSYSCPMAEARVLLAPVYLRRLRDDVLTELPPKIEKTEWVTLTNADREAYREAVMSDHFMNLRQAATLGDEELLSAKMFRLQEIIEEYRDEGLKVLVFSYFRAVVAAVGDLIPQTKMINGDTRLKDRDKIIADFTEADEFCLLALQISVGAEGLNLQQAAAVVLMEPQWKPSTEEQAISRAHRMGQSRSVVVHRLVAMDTVDMYMLSILAKKREEFEHYAQHSSVKDANPEAIAIDNQEVSLLAQERARLLGKN